MVEFVPIFLEFSLFVGVGKFINCLYNFVFLPNGFLQARIITETIVQVYRLPKALGILKEKLKLRSQT